VLNRLQAEQRNSRVTFSAQQVIFLFSSVPGLLGSLPSLQFSGQWVAISPKNKRLGRRGSITPSNAWIKNKFSYTANTPRIFKLWTRNAWLFYSEDVATNSYHKVYINLLQNLWTGSTIGISGHPYRGSV